MNEPTRQECERKFPQLKVDPEWQMYPVVGRDGDHIGYACIYSFGGRTFVTPVLRWSHEEARQ